MEILKNFLANVKEKSKNIMPKGKRGVGGNIVKILVTVLISVSLLPILSTAISTATNLTTVQTTLLLLIPTLIIIGIVLVSMKDAGLK